ncbi:MAG: hypothetical protein FWE99_05455, partial [Bacteroidales bacterium]|nr:hypothetical protein [Bacteroidales bacterium]
PSGTVTYYRANIHPEGSMQLLRRNHAYSLTIRSVSGPGAVTEELAYIGQGNSLEYSIGIWNLDDNGLIVSDDFSILSLPTKKINIGWDASVSTFSIYTFTTLPDAQGLTIRSQTYNPMGNGIRAHLDGNTLVIEADALSPDEMERRGVVVLSFAGLENSISIHQSGTASDYLRVHLPDGGIPRFPYFAGLFSGVIRVEASDFWTAKLYMSGFSFGPQLHPQPPITTLRSTDGLVDNHRFRVYTHSLNDGTAARDAFIVVSLDKDPDNYSSVIRLSQAKASALRLTPEQATVTFDGLGALANLGGVSNVNTFEVNPGLTAGAVDFWTAEIITPHGAIHDDRLAFQIMDRNNNVVPNNSPNLWDAADLSLNVVKAGAVGMNVAGRQQIAVLRIYLGGDPTVYTDITLIQQPVDVSLVPGTVPNVPTVGGQTQAIRVDAFNWMTWSAVINPEVVWLNDGRTLLHHTATLVDQNGNPLVEGQAYPVSTQFRVHFPKVYYPNRDIPISVNVTVTIGGTMTRNIRVSQNILTSNGAVGYGMTGSPAWGGFGDTYNQGWDAALAQIPGYVRSGIGNMNAASIASNVTYLHVVPHGTSGSYNWLVVNNFIDNRDAWTVLSHQATNRDGINNANSPLKRNGAGYNNVDYIATTINSRLLPTNTKLFEFVTTRGNTPISHTLIGDFHNDGINTMIPGPWPPGAIVLMTKHNNTNHAQLIVDLKRKFMYIGESQIFWNAANLTNNRNIFLDNFMYFIGNAMKYGSHFTDLLLDDPLDPDTQPAPWDAHWGNNRLVPNGVPSK